jgi:hypothetical protein
VVKKIISDFLLFIAILLILDLAIGKTLRHFYFTESSGLHYRTTYSMESTRAEVLVFGASRANHHYVPEIFEDSLNMSFYNTGRDGNGVFYQEAVLKSVLKRYHPKIILFDWAGKFNNDSDSYDRLAALLPYERTHPEIRSIIGLKSRFERIKLLSEIYPFNSEILTIAIGNSEMNKKRKSDNKGYVPLTGNFVHTLESDQEISVYDIDPNKVNAFREFISIAKKSGIMVFIIFSPVYLKYSWSQEADICGKICRYEKVPFIDLSQDPTFLSNNTLFFDRGHLNNAGAILFSQLMVGKIKNHLAHSYLANH